MNTEAEIRQTLREWIIKTSGKIKAEELTDETPIIEQRIISSLQIMDLILFLEQQTAYRGVVTRGGRNDAQKGGD